MEQFLNQVKHNEDFHLTLASQNNNRFFDWKVTCLFYIAVHCLKALASKNNKNIGFTHKDVELSVSPLKNAVVMPLPSKAWSNYSIMYRYSMACRYDGFTDPDTFEEIKRTDYNHALQCLNGFKGYIKGQGVPIPEL